MSVANQILEQAEPHSHYVQFYKADEPLLNRNVGYYLWEGILRGDGLIVIATDDRRRSLTDHLERLGVNVDDVRKERALVFLDAQKTLDRFMVDGEPNPVLFSQVIEAELGRVRRPSDGGSTRAYGEMVGLLWQDGQFDAAIRLEEYWNQAIRASGITLFCGYPIDVFADDLQSARLQAVMCNHTHVLPAGADGDMESAVQKAIHEVFGPDADAVRVKISAENAGLGGRLLPAEAAILWLRKNVPARAADILSKARSFYAEKSEQCAA